MKVSKITKFRQLQNSNISKDSAKISKVVKAKPKNNSPKPVHLSKKEVAKRIDAIKAEIADCKGKEGKGKRKRLYYRLKQLDIAKNNEALIKDPQENLKKKQNDKKKRIEKKLSKSKTDILEKRNKNIVCHFCKKRGHLMSECKLKDTESNTLGQVDQNLCFKCGSLDHSLYFCESKNEGMPFATCFVCKAVGHITRDCPQNELGLYRKGGSCHVCKSVRHFAMDCPERQKREDQDIKFKRNDNRELIPEGIEEE